MVAKISKLNPSPTAALSSATITPDVYSPCRSYLHCGVKWKGEALQREAKVEEGLGIPSSPLFPFEMETSYLFLATTFQLLDKDWFPRCESATNCPTLQLKGLCPKDCFPHCKNVRPIHILLYMCSLLFCLSLCLCVFCSFF